MKTEATIVYTFDDDSGYYIGYIKEYPGILTQHKSMPELEQRLSTMLITYYKHCTELLEKGEYTLLLEEKD